VKDAWAVLAAVEELAILGDFALSRLVGLARYVLVALLV
jgi:hypothetical protein